MPPVELEPLVALVPDQAPEAVQEEALVDDQVNVELPPLETLVGSALSETVGAGAICVSLELAAVLSVADPAQPDRRTIPKVMLQATNLRTSSFPRGHSD